MNNIEKYEEIIPLETRNLISKRYHSITSAINKEFWNLNNDKHNSFYVGSYGRGTAINTSDIDILVILPEHEYNHYNSLKGNGQSRLLQAVKEVIIGTYPRTDIRADGQVIKVDFVDGIKFEILPAFKNQYNLKTYKYPDTNMGGNWCSTNPKAEQEAITEKNKVSNGLLLDTCKHIRFIRDNKFNSYHLSGIVIDSFVYHAMGNWRNILNGEKSISAWGDYEKNLLNYLNQNTDYWGTFLLSTPGSNEKIEASKSLECLKKVLEFMVKEKRK